MDSKGGDVLEIKTRIQRKRDEKKNKNDQRKATGLAILSIVVDVVAIVVTWYLAS